MNDTIVAISSGSKINQPIGIVRMSGQDSLDILGTIFKGNIPKNTGKHISYGYIYDGQKLVDEVLVMLYIGTGTFTGETMVEINCHGGIVVSNWILELLLSHGARLAKNGEFSQRAFLNNKIDLTKADAIHDMIFAKTKTQVALSANKFTSKTFDFISKMIDELEYIIGNLEANIDYPEYYDIEDINNSKFSTILNKISTKIQQMIEKSENNIRLFEGIKILILGKPNVGKSSVLNALKKEEKAIVTDIEGTTRDTIEVDIQINNILFKIIDTAGAREATNPIEKLGIERGFNLIKNTDIVIHLIDDRVENDFDAKIKQETVVNKKVYLKVQNKKDLVNENKNNITISALNHDIEPLENELLKYVKDIDLDADDSINNIRQLSLVKKAKLNIDEATQALKENATPDVVIIDVVGAWESLKEITGDVNREDLIDAIFRNFCLGK